MLTTYTSYTLSATPDVRSRDLIVLMGSSLFGLRFSPAIRGTTGLLAGWILRARCGDDLPQSATEDMLRLTKSEFMTYVETAGLRRRVL